MTLIDGDRLNDSIHTELCADLECDTCSMRTEDGGCKVEKWLDDAPSIDIEPKRGEWKRRIVDNGFNADWVCSECGYRVKTDFVDYNFCPNCGADMKGADDE